MATKVQPSLTITQLGISKLPTGTAGSVIGQAGVGSNIQSISNANNNANSNTAGNAAGGASPSMNAGSVTPTSITGSTVTVSQSGQLLTTQNLVSSAAGGATVVPLAITSRSGAAGTILTGTITPIKNGITVGKVMSQAQVAAMDSHNMQNVSVAGSSAASSTATVTSVSAKKMPGGKLLI